ncbi:carbamoyltransferase C-terminal domain-containing protein [Derxia gummosa]|uniref:Carbamoyltransferase C-terminal domain-containing protein n=1 Tax=Derxia gummosa DSM 723 TaxID=1121388 RepID=A0A8B6X8H3_9BURK|nr:carbamoyltransferase C-terminal domain-containing protein [Derxia gummosa]
MTTAVLGLNLGQDAAAALFVDGELVAAVEQERFDADRHSAAFPTDAVRFVLAQAGLDVKALAGLAVGDDRITEADRAALAALGLPEPFPVPHALAHAEGAFASSGFASAAVLVADGHAHGDAVAIFHADARGVVQLAGFGCAQSPGDFYSRATALCGLATRSGQEGKLMGLAPWGTAVDAAYVHAAAEPSDAASIAPAVPDAPLRPPVLPEALMASTTPHEPFGPASRALAFAAQREIERFMLDAARRAFALTGARRLCLAGGVALNCNANAAIAALPGLEALHIQPAANNAGTAAGAAAHFLRRRGIAPVVREQVRLGPDLSDTDIAGAVGRAVREGRVHARCVADAAAEAAARIAAGEVIGWCHGRAEFGPRALGNRSIVALPDTAARRDRVNAIKRREAWRPLAPSVLAECAADWFVDARPSPHMLLTFKVRPEKRLAVPAIVHVDGSARVQTVTARDNPRYHALISEVARLTGLPLVLNTSLNTRSKPMVLTASDCIDCLLDSGLDAAFIGDWLVLPG